MNRKKSFVLSLTILLTTIINSNYKTIAAENIVIYKGIIGRKITIKSLDDVAKGKDPKGTLKNIMALTNQNKQDVANFLNQEYELPIVLTSKLINSKIGTVVITRITKIIYPDKRPQASISVPAIRAGVINGIVKGDGKLSLINFLKFYPNKNIAINYGALNKVINKVESMTDLVEFFTGSPLEKLKSNPSI